MSAEIISVVNQKGGTGKTTTTMNLGSALAAEGRRVLLVDLDPQANLSYALGIGEAVHTVADLISGAATLEEVCVQAFDNIDILPGSAELVDIEISLVSQPRREYFLRECLSSARERYDYILIDSPPSLSLLTLNSLSAADGVLIPMQLEVLSLQGLSQILNTVNQVQRTTNPGLQVRGILIVMYDRRRKLSGEVEEFLQENVNYPVFNSRIRLNVKIAEAPSFGQPVLMYDPTSHGARDYAALAREFLGIKPKGDKKKKKTSALPAQA